MTSDELPQNGPMLGLSGWFSGKGAGVEPSARALSALCRRLDLRRIGRPMCLRRAGGALALSLLAESHLAWTRTAPGMVSLTLFSCVALDTAWVERAAAPLLGAGRWRWAARGPAAVGRPGPAPTPSGARWLLSHPDPDGACAALRARLPPGPERLHAFSPHGRTLARRLPDGLVVVHTWPEHGLLTVDLDGSAPERLGALLAALALRPLPEAPGQPA